MTALARLARTEAPERPRVLVADGQCADPARAAARVHRLGAFSAAPGNSVRMEDLTRWLESNGFSRASTVRDVGDYATAAAFSISIRPAPPRRSGSISSATRSNRSAPSIRRRSAATGSCARSISCR
jgi:transcription-repair coupling factor (superfamily II helicase)